MKLLIKSIVFNIIIIILPLLFHPELLLTPKILWVIAGTILIWVTQPIPSSEEVKKDKSTDKSSVILIFIMAYVSLMAPIIIWEFFVEDKSGFSFVSVLGVVTLLTGIAIRYWAVRELGIYFTPTVQIQEGHKLIQTGPYKFVRHPSYTGAFMALTSFALILDTLPGFVIAVIAMIISYKIRIELEEKELTLFFKDEYSNYSKRVKKIIPFVY